MFKKGKNGKANINKQPYNKGAKILAFLFILLIIVILINIMLILSKIQIKIKNIHFNSLNVKRKLSSNYKIIITVYILRKIPIFKINITQTKLEKLQLKEKVRQAEIDIIKNKKKIDKKLLKEMKKIKLQIKYWNLQVLLGTEDAKITALIVGYLSIFLGIYLNQKISKHENQKFSIQPAYIGQNILNLIFEGIFEIKTVNIINIIWNLKKKERRNENERTSNRRTYDYSYE